MSWKMLPSWEWTLQQPLGSLSQQKRKMAA
jgi:hypothetical protein